MGALVAWCAIDGLTQRRKERKEVGVEGLALFPLPRKRLT